MIRLTAAPAKRLQGGPISQAGDYPVRWSASRWDQVDREHLRADAVIEGRLIAYRIGRGKKKEWLYLFTTLSISAERVVALYGQRWNVETDLRSLKRTVRLHHLNLQSVDMLEKELIVAVLAYNLVRAIMCLAARKAGVHARQLSFTYASNIVHSAFPDVLAATTEIERLERMERIVDLVSRCRLPKRRKRRSCPRAVWGQSSGYPFRRSSEN